MTTTGTPDSTQIDHVDDRAGELTRSSSEAAEMSLQDQLAKMRRDWDDRAVENAQYYVCTKDLTEDEFFATGETTVGEVILNDMSNICLGKPCKEMRVVEIGCGVGRVTRVLARIFGEVHAVDISGEMVRRARHNLSGCGNVFTYQNNGADLSVLPPLEFDFVFSHLVFQHIPSKNIIENYVRDVHRILRPGALFKFQLQGDTSILPHLRPDDTWVGAPFSEDEVLDMAQRCGFESRYRVGAGGQYFWNWFFAI